MRRSLVLILSWGAAFYLIQVRWRPALAGASEYRTLQRASPALARLVDRAFMWGLASGVPLVALGFLNLLEVHGILPGAKRRRHALPPWPSPRFSGPSRSAARPWNIDM